MVELCCRKEQQEALRKSLVLPLLAGLASHHAGCLPAWKALVEQCFQQGQQPRESFSVSLQSIFAWHRSQSANLEERLYHLS